MSCAGGKASGERCHQTYATLLIPYSPFHQRFVNTISTLVARFLIWKNQAHIFIRAFRLKEEFIPMNSTAEILKNIDITVILDFFFFGATSVVHFFL